MEKNKKPEVKPEFDDDRPIHDEKLHIRQLYEYCKEHNIDSTKLTIEDVKKLGFYY